MRVLIVTNIYPTPMSPSAGTFVERQVKSLEGLGLDVEVLFVNRSEEGMRAYLGLRRRVRDRVAHFGPDIVHVMYGGFMADETTSAVREVPTMVSFCGSDLFGENLSGLSRKLVSRYGVLCSHRAARRADGVIVKSEGLRGVLPADVNPLKIRVIPSGVDLERFQPRDRVRCLERLGWRPDCFHIVFPANGGDPVKRPELARAAVEALRKSGVDAEIHPLRGVAHDQVPTWLNAASAVLLTSLHEGSPNIIKEALACNAPVVAVDVGDVSERIRGIEGCHIAPPNSGGLAAALLKVHAGPRRVDGRARVQELSLERTAQRYEKFYREVMLWRRRSALAGRLLESGPQH